MLFFYLIWVLLTFADRIDTAPLSIMLTHSVCISIKLVAFIAVEVSLRSISVGRDLNTSVLYVVKITTLDGWNFKVCALSIVS